MTRSSRRDAWWNDAGTRALIYQFVAVALVFAVGWYLVNNTLENLATRQIATGFGYLQQESGFEIAESPIPYSPASTYGRALVVGVLNTLTVAFLGVIFATIIGTVVGIMRLSTNWLVAKLAMVYVEAIRNVPLLLQLFFWYLVIAQLMPGPRQALQPAPGVFLSNRGIYIPAPAADPIWTWVTLAFIAGVIATYMLNRWAKRRQEASGVRPPTLLPGLGLILGLPIAVWVAGGAPIALDVPELRGFNFQGGVNLTPEFAALLFGLTIYTAAFIAEIVRAGIQAVSYGQWEAGTSLGLPRSRVLRLIVLPQAVRIIVPPMTSQYLNLTKNSSLAVAIGYPDLVSIANTTLNQTGQAIENISILMAVYLTISLSISMLMNWYNSQIALRER